MKLSCRNWIKSPGIGGSVQKPEDFIVREIIHPKFLRKFDSHEKKYTLFLVRKRNMTTSQMIKKLSSAGFADIGYAGLKDKFAVTFQYVSAVAEEKEYSANDVTATPVGKSRKIFIGDLSGNEFVITLHGCKNKESLKKIFAEISKRGLPNYFGGQRFGKNKNNHIIGKCLVKKEFNAALKAINENGAKESSLKYVPKRLLKFFVNAYQSWIFNETLNRYIGKNSRPCFKEIPLVGYSTVLGNSRMETITRNICRKEGITPKDFRIDELRLSCSGDRRKAFISLTGIDFVMGSNTVKLCFTLPKGSYATEVLGEICK